ncbi:glucosylceramidase-like [Copidosoma floridanum]|uniref:glucosylceramidase-like n=1 Tax=Copidosoma floridanum TaxID=29053 RepID=UPI000C6F4C91|nr:glucosylceramidase-like [Copidosoma floridanum]
MMFKFIGTIFSVILIVLAQDCIPVDFGSDSTVCQCNSTYCDYYSDPASPKKGEFIWYVSSKSGERLKRFGGIISNHAENTYNIKIDSNTQHQSIEGFGGAFTDSAGINIKKLSKGCQDHIMKSYFSNDGIKYNLGRVPIAGTDFSTRPYTYDDSPGDTELENFMLAKEDFVYKMPLMKQALDLSPSLRFETSAWSAPPWMKKHDQYNNFGAGRDENPKVILGSWSRAEQLVKKLFENFNHWIVGWIDWNLALDKQGGPNWVNNFVDAFIIVDPDKDVFYKQPMFYAFAHFSKFVPRSSVRINTSSSDDIVLSTAFKTTNGEIVALLYNTSDKKKSVTISDKKVGSINLVLPPASIHTILYKN